MRSVDLDVESAVFIRVTGNGSELGDFAAGLDPRGMDGIRSIRREAFLTVFDAGVQFAGDVLIESAAETNVEALTTVANCQSLNVCLGGTNVEALTTVANCQDWFSEPQ